MGEMEQTYTIKEAAARLRLAEATVRRYLVSGKMKGMKIGRVWRISAADFNAFLDENRRGKNDS